MPAPIPTRADQLRPGDVILASGGRPLEVLRVELLQDGPVALSVRRQDSTDLAPVTLTRRPDLELRRRA